MWDVGREADEVQGSRRISSPQTLTTNTILVRMSIRCPIGDGILQRG